MDGISSTTRALIERLETERRPRDRLSGRFDPTLIDALGASGERGAAVALVPLVLTRHPDTAERAAATVHRLMCGASARELARLDAQVRRSTLPGSRWSDLRPDRIALLAERGEAATALLGMASFHGDGYVREATIHELDRLETGREVAFLLIRANDWVPQVRRAAEAALMGRLEQGRLDGFVEALPLVARLRRSERDVSEPLLVRIADALAGAEAVPALEKGTAAPDREVRRAAYPLLGRLVDGAVLEELLDRALADRDVLVRAWGAERLEAGDVDTERYLPTLLADPAVRVRRRGLLLVLDADGATADRHAEAALFDRSAAIRDLARRHLGNRGRVGCADVYRRALHQQNRPLSTVVAGLGETGDAADADRVAPWLDTESVRLRQAALRAVARLDADRFHDRIYQALLDPAPRVSREARVLFATRAARLSRDRLAHDLTAGHPPHVRRNLLLLAARLHKWDAFPLLARGTMDEDADLAELGRRLTRAWIRRFNRSFTTPTPAQVRRLRAVVDRFRFSLPADVRREIDSIVRGLPAA